MGSPFLGVHIGVHVVSKQVKEYQKGWQRIKAREAYKIRGLERFLNIIETFQTPLISAPKAGALNQAALRPD
ncbi:MAG: hypothetical protein KAS98_13315 [Deltaproteobacteria bacterium]|jgi:hypothetical protein|nr:hypothetical protein [Deltaproteobacteria bacterium]